MYKKNGILFLTICSTAIIIAANYETQTDRQENNPSDYGRLLSDAYKVIEKYELEKGTFSNIDYFKERSNAVIENYDPQPLTTGGLVNRVKNYRELKLERFELVRFMIGYAKKVAPKDVAIMHAAFDCRVKNISFNHSMDQECHQLFIKHKNNAAKIVESHLNANNHNMIASQTKENAIEKTPTNTPQKIVTMMPVIEDGETYDAPVKVAFKPIAPKNVAFKPIAPKNVAFKPIAPKKMVKKEKNSTLAKRDNQPKIQEARVVKPQQNVNDITGAIEKQPINTPQKIVTMMPVLEDDTIYDAPIKVSSQSIAPKNLVKKEKNSTLATLENQLATLENQLKAQKEIVNNDNSVVKAQGASFVEINPFTQKVHQPRLPKPIFAKNAHMDLSETTNSIVSKVPQKPVIQSSKLADDGSSPK